MLKAKHTTTAAVNGKAPDETRRRLVIDGAMAALVGAAASIGKAAKAASGPDPIFPALAEYLARQTEWQHAIYATAKFMPGDEKTDAGKAAEARIEVTSEAQQEAGLALLNTVPTTAAGVVALLQFAVDHLDAADGEGWLPDDLLPDNVGPPSGRDGEYGFTQVRDWPYFVMLNAARALTSLVVA